MHYILIIQIHKNEFFLTTFKDSFSDLCDKRCELNLLKLLFFNLTEQEEHQFLKYFL